MGQYFKAVNVDTLEWMQSNSFLKLTETSWVGNDFMFAVMKNLIPDGKWFKQRIIWAGDYYHEDGEVDYYHLVKTDDKIIYKDDNQDSIEWQSNCILVNFSKKEYVNYKNLPENDGWIINPLPLLVACGNDRGGGDYDDMYPDFEKVGIWAFDRIGVLQEIPKDFTELKVNFKIQI